MTINPALSGLISFVSNSPGIPTGYGQQAEYLTNNMVRAGLDVAILSNYGTEGMQTTIEIANKKVHSFPRGFNNFSTDNLLLNHEYAQALYPNKKNAIFILYDSWVYLDAGLDNENVVIWVPLDHLTIPPAVAAFLKKENVTVISMSPDGNRQLDAVGIKNTYIPHVIDKEIYKPTFETRGKKTRDFMGISDDTFLVGMVSANKANGIVHRKAFAENILAFATFWRNHPEAKLYIHSEASKIMGGFNLINLFRACGLPQEAVIMPSVLDLRYGITRNEMAALYTTFDVLLATSLGEGFGVPTIEAQACGTRAIVSNWTASQDLVSENSWKVEGYPFWDEPQSAWWKIPAIDSIVAALEEAYKAPRGVDEASLKFADNFEDKKIWQEKWLPFWSDYFAKQSDNSSSE
jgi:glycosyltransferase involved in cell wall biosynthesis